jgi:hypothetical protein
MHRHLSPIVVALRDVGIYAGGPTHRMTHCAILRCVPNYSQHVIADEFEEFLPRRNVRGSPDTRLLIGRTDGGRSRSLLGTRRGRPGLMRMDRRNQRSDLTAAEQKFVGGPGDLVSEDAVPPRARAGTVMISLRVDREVFDDLSRIAQHGGRTLSETAREALRSYVDAHRADTSYPLGEHRLIRSDRRVSENTQATWADDELFAALERYEAACREAGMRDNAWRSYVDYARRFLAWRTGDYQPRGSSAGDRPVPRTAASTEELRGQAATYARLVKDAGREQPTVDTYLRHAMFFIRWLDGEFRPGARLHGLR